MTSDDVAAGPAGRKAPTDLIRAGLRQGWKVMGGPHGPPPASMSCDVAIVGSGAGAGVTAELLCRAGLDVVMVEEGPLKSSSDFHQLEAEAYPTLYQESAARKTADKAITILQGRCVGGSTTVNWTSSFRTPEDTLTHWREQYALDGMSVEEMAPWFEQAERRFNISDWPTSPNQNNELLRFGTQRLGLTWAGIRRNVKGCWNLGSCGMGCPTNAKQSMLVTTIPAALEAGTRLLVQTRVMALEAANGHVQALECTAMGSDGEPSLQRTRLVCKHVVVAGGAINSPALLMRSKIADPYQRLGARTFLHPTVISAAVMPDVVQGWQGAPQSLYSDHFLRIAPLDGPLGYKLEVPPIHPLIFSTTVPGHGRAQTELLRNMPYSHVLLALLRDGFHPESAGGRVHLRSDGSPVLDYPLTALVMDGARRAMLTMAELQFAAGAHQVLPVHEAAYLARSWAEAKHMIEALPMKPLLTRVVSAHVMGGCGMAGREDLGVVRPDGVHWQVDNLSVHDGSLFPTSIGANPQLSIYGLVNRLASGLAKRMTGRTVHLEAT